MNVNIVVDRWIEINTDLEPTFKEIAGMMLESVSRNFAQGGRPDRWQNKSDGSSRHLLGTGRLRDSLKESSGPDFAEVSTDVPYGRYHQFGAKIPVTDKSRGFFWAKFFETGDEKWKWMALSKKNVFILPESPFMLFQEEDKQEIGKMLMTGIVRFVEPSHD